MKILFIGPYRQADEWGQVSRDFIKTLNLTEHDIVTRPIFLSTSRLPKLESSIENLEQQDIGQCDTIIQHALPFALDYNGMFKKNIAISSFESNNIQYTGWPNQINLMDEIWVISHQEKKNLITSGVKIPIKVVTAPIDSEKFNKSYEKLSIPDINMLDSFKFYFIGDLNVHRNINAVIAAFHVEFDRSENVSLILHLSAHPSEVEQYMQRIKKALRIYEDLSKYKKEIVITIQFTEEQMCQLHYTCDCFVMPSHGESLCQQAINAIGFGNIPIVTDQTGMTTFVDNKIGWLIPSRETIPIMENPPIPYLYTGRETWQTLDVIKLKEAMRTAYNLWKYEPRKLKQKQQLCRNKIDGFSYGKIADKISKLLV